MLSWTAGPVIDWSVGTVLQPLFATLSALLVLAGAIKLREPAPAGGGRARAAIGGAEVALGGAALLVPGRWPAVIMAGVFAVFSVHVGRLLARGGPADCGCFGAADPPLDSTHLVLDLCGVAVAAAAAVWPPPGLGWLLSRPAPVALTLVAGIAAATVGVYSLFTRFPVAWRAYGSGTG